VKLALYLLYSLIATVVDSAVVWFLVKYSLAGLVPANTAGVLSGFAIHYILSLKSVFETKIGTNSFLIYFVTFLGGLALANTLIYYSYEYAFAALQEDLRILASKGVSIVIPFFILYYARKRLFSYAQNKEKRK